MAKIAVIKTGGKQYLVEEGAVLKVEKIAGAHKVGDTVEFADVLLTDDGSTLTTGSPVKGEKVKAEILEISRHPTVTVIKYRQKSRYFKKNGHRQPYTKVKVTSV